MVEQITAGNLPLGIFHDLEPELCTRQLLEGDYVIMVSDGIVEGLPKVCARMQSLRQSVP